MKSSLIWKIATLVLAVALAFTLAWSFQPDVTAKPRPQPNMRKALNHLKKAHHFLKIAVHNKGGHRVKALGHVNNAILEVELGIKAGNE
jgi:hypothetical protein